MVRKGGQESAKHLACLARLLEHDAMAFDDVVVQNSGEKGGRRLQINKGLAENGRISK